MDASIHHKEFILVAILVSAVVAISANGQQQQELVSEANIIKSSSDGIAFAGSPKKFRENIENFKQKQLQQVQLPSMVHKTAEAIKPRIEALNSLKKASSNSLFRPEETKNIRQPTTVHGLVEGTAGVDFPGLTRIPAGTKFRCSGSPYRPGMYADESTGCQVYHLCFDGRQESFLCGIGTRFNQANLVCDYWHQVDCSKSSKYFNSNLNFGKSTTLAGGKSTLVRMKTTTTKGHLKLDKLISKQEGESSVAEDRRTLQGVIEATGRTSSAQRVVINGGEIPKPPGWHLKLMKNLSSGRSEGSPITHPTVGWMMLTGDTGHNHLSGGSGGNSLKTISTSLKGVTSPTKITNSTIDTPTKPPQHLQAVSKNNQDNLPARKTISDGSGKSTGPSKEATAAEDNDNSNPSLRRPIQSDKMGSSTSGTSTTTATIVSTPSGAISTENSHSDEPNNDDDNSRTNSKLESTTQIPPPTPAFPTTARPSDSRIKLDPVPVETRAPDTSTSSTGSSGSGGSVKMANDQSPEKPTEAPDSTTSQEDQPGSITIEESEANPEPEERRASSSGLV